MRQTEPPKSKEPRDTARQALGQGHQCTRSIHSKFRASEHEGAVGRVRMKSLGSELRSQVWSRSVSSKHTAKKSSTNLDIIDAITMQAQCSQDSSYASQRCVEHAVWKKFPAIESQYPGFFESHWNLMQWNLGTDIRTSGTAMHTQKDTWVRLQTPAVLPSL